MSGRVVIVADRLFDGYRFVEPARVSFEGGVVVAVGADVTDLPSVRLDGMSLLPGFVDCHQHLVFDGNGTYEEQVADRSDAELRTERASFGSFFCERVVSSTRALDARTGGTSNTVSPAATSCWATR